MIPLNQRSGENFNVIVPTTKKKNQPKWATVVPKGTPRSLRSHERVSFAHRAPVDILTLLKRKVLSILGEASLDGLKKHSKKGVGKNKNYTRNEWRRGTNTLETSGEEAQIHSKRVEKI